MTSLIILILATAIYSSSVRQSPVNLGSARNYVILAQSGITTTGSTKIEGDIATSPSAATSLTGFSMTLDSGGTFSTSPLVKGRIGAADYASPTPSRLTRANNDVVAAYNDAAGRSNPDKVNFGINGPSILRPGVYKWTSALSVEGNITLTGNSRSMYIFQIDGTLDFQSTSKIILSRGLCASNVIWQSSGAVTVEAGAQVQGIILGKTGISFKSGATLVRGRAFAQTQVTLISNTINKP